MVLNSITYTSVNSGTTYSVTSGSQALSPSSKGERNSIFPEEKVTLSQEGKDKSAETKSPAVSFKSGGGKTTENLGQQELEQLQQLKHRDTEVRDHEQAHLSAAGTYAKGGASFTYQKGPDGALYAIGGEVGVDVSEESTPEATISKMETIKRAALAPANPSGADKMIASQADAKVAQARQELLETQQKEALQRDSAAEFSSWNQAATDGGTASAASTSDSATAKLAAYVKIAEA